jgi:tetratricopeptide (TPR) repeat protein
MGKIIRLGCFLLLSYFGYSQSNTLFDQATEAYNKGAYEEAITNYLKILENGEHSAALYFNLGNAYYKRNEIASSIYYYEKALLLTPNDAEIHNNLAYAQNMTLDAIDNIPQTGLAKLYANITNILTFDQWASVAVVFMILFVLLYILFAYATYSSRKRWAFISSLAALFICVLSVIFAFVQYRDFKSYQPAIVFADEIGIRSEPNNNSEEVFTLHAGTKVNVLDELNSWQKIRIADGKTGWIPASEIKVLKDF